MLGIFVRYFVGALVAALASAGVLVDNDVASISAAVTAVIVAIVEYFKRKGVQ